MARKPKVVAIIRARMSSTRLPGKSLIDICEKPMIWHLFNRISKAKKIDEIILATSNLKSDDSLAKYVKGLGYRVFRFNGDINDVVGRILAAAKWAKADIIAGICGDCPLIDPKFIDDVVDGMVKSNADSAKLKKNLECQHEGLDICTINALQAQYGQGTKPHHKEHLNIYLKENPDKFKWFEVNLSPPFSKHLLRLSVDTPSDLNFMREIYKRLWDKRTIVNLKKVISLYKKDVDLRNINSAVQQKSITDISRRFIIRTDASSAVGLGHLRRMLAVARILQDSFFSGVLFIIKKNQIAEKIIAENGYNFKTINLEGEFYKFVKENAAFGTIIIDTLSKIQPCFVKLPGRKLIVIDRIDKLAQNADLCVLPDAHNSVKTTSKVASGFNYVIIRDEIKLAKRKPGKYVLVSFGGSDPKNITAKVLGFLLKMKPTRPLGIYIGPFNNRRKAIMRLAKKFGKKAFIFGVNYDFGDALANCSFAIVGFGQTVYEALYLKVPVLAISHHVENISNSKFKQLSFVKYIGEIDKLKQEKLNYWVNKFACEHAEMQKKMNRACLIDDFGARRIAEKIYNCHG